MGGKMERDKVAQIRALPWRVALVTGAARGIGAATARRLATSDYYVVLAGRSETVLQHARALSNEGHSAEGRVVDISDEQQVEALFGWLAQRFGKLDVLVNNAGISPKVNNDKAHVIEMDPADWDRVLQINLTGTFLMSRAAIPLLRNAADPRIINVSSQAGRARSGITAAHYAASKTAMIGLARGLAEELGPEGITVNTVAPGRTETDMITTVPDAINDRIRVVTPVRRLGHPDEVAEAIAYLAGPNTGFVNGAIIDINGGSFMP